MNAVDPATTAAASSSLMWQFIVGQVVLVLLSIITTWTMLRKTSRDQTHALDVIKLQHEIDAADRREKAATERAERDANAASIRERLITDAASMQTAVHQTADSVRDRVDAVALRTDAAKLEIKDDTRVLVAAQTAELKAAIDAATRFTGDKTDAAIEAGNHLAEKFRAQGEVLRRLLEVIASTTTDPPVRGRRADDPPGYVGRRSDDPPGVIIPAREQARAPS